MKIRLLGPLALTMLWTGSLFAQTTDEPTVPAVSRPVLWSVRFDAARLRAGVGKELFANLDLMLSSLFGKNASVPGGKLESAAIYGFPPKDGRRDDPPFVADVRFAAEGGGIAQRFDALSKKHDASVETLNGMPVIHFDHKGGTAWIAKPDDSRLLVSTSRQILEIALNPTTNDFLNATPARPDETLGGKVEIRSLVASYPALRDVEVLNLAPHVEFHILTAENSLDLDASAQMDSDRSAKRAVQVLNGMVAALAMRDTSGIAWDERLGLKQDGAQLRAQFHLTAQEARALFNHIGEGIEDLEDHHAAKRDE